MPLLTSYREVFNSDDVMYGGAGHINKKPLVAHEEPYHGKPYHIRMTIPPYAITILRPTRKREGKESHGTKKCVAMLLAGGQGSRLSSLTKI